MRTGSKVSFGFTHTFADQLPECYVKCEPEAVDRPHLSYFNEDLAKKLGLSGQLSAEEPELIAEIFSGNPLPSDSLPIAQAYSGHQFGHFNPQLGDGRALIIGELGEGDARVDVCLKGSGRTPFSRSGDGKAALAPMLREVLIAEAMHALGIPTTRSLAVVATGEEVFRDPVQPGAVLTRIAASHIRVGTFQYVALRRQGEHLKQLADYTIERHYPECRDADSPYLSLLEHVIDRQASLIAQWMGVGFIHGVMNTDNMSISGETIDYGPCAFMDDYDPKTVYSSIDRRGRYAYQNQPFIAQWNLARLAETLLPLLSDDEDEAVTLATAAVDSFSTLYKDAFASVMRRKLGITNTAGETFPGLLEDWLAMLAEQSVDFTQSHYALYQFAKGNKEPIFQLFSDRPALGSWLVRWKGCHQPDPVNLDSMRFANPRVIPRNHLVEEALEAASDNTYAPFHKLLDVITRPYGEGSLDERYRSAAPEGFAETYRTFCGT